MMLGTSLYTMTLDKIESVSGSIKAAVLEDADGDASYIRDIANHGCVSGACRGLVYYNDTEAWFIKHLAEIDELVQDLQEQGTEPLAYWFKNGGSLSNFLTWLAYEVTAQNILNELEGDSV